MMFEVGKEYDFTESWGGESYDFRATVLEVDGTLLKLDRGGYETIFNTSASSFSSAREFDLIKLKNLPEYLAVPPAPTSAT